MIQLYKKDGERLLYREAWVDDATGIIHYGTTGHRGTQEHHSVRDEATFFTSFESDAREKGYEVISDEDKFWLVVQYPLKSRLGSQRDRWLKERASENLDAHLGSLGLGYVDGHDIGNFKLNIFCVVVDEPSAIKAAKGCLRRSRLDFSRALVATRGYCSEDDYVLRYASKPVDAFSVL